MSIIRDVKRSIITKMMGTEAGHMSRSLHVVDDSTDGTTVRIANLTLYPVGSIHGKPFQTFIAPLDLRDFNRFFVASIA